MPQHRENPSAPPVTDEHRESRLSCGRGGRPASPGFIHEGVVAVDQARRMVPAHCVYPCTGVAEIGSTLATIGVWHELAVPLLAAGLDPSTVNTPWLVYSEAPLVLTVEDIRRDPWTTGPDPDCTPFIP